MGRFQMVRKLRRLGPAAKAWGIALALVMALLEALAVAFRSRRVVLVVFMLLGAAGWGARSCGGRAGMRVATFNIQNYGARDTDDSRLRQLLGELDADLIALQEIQDEARLARLVPTINTDRDYRYVLSRCGGESKMRVGFIVDAKRVRVLGKHEYPDLQPDGKGSCSDRERPGLLLDFSFAGERAGALVVHLAAWPSRIELRKKQVESALAILARYRSEHGAPVALLGDYNTTGYLDDAQGERSQLQARLRVAGMRLITGLVGCSAYFKPEGRPGHYEPSLLDHIAVTPSFPVRTGARVTGYCASARCRPIDGAPPTDYTMVSDHCPVVVGAR